MSQLLNNNLCSSIRWPLSLSFLCVGKYKIKFYESLTEKLLIDNNFINEKRRKLKR